MAYTVHYWLEHGAGLVRVVDNGSADGTAAAARSAGAEVFHEPQRGYGAAVWRGLMNLPERVEWILFSSADGSDRLNGPEAAAFQSAIDAGADLVLGERVSLPESRKRLGALQRFGNAFCCRWLALAWNYSFRDMASLRLIRKSAFERLQLADRGFGWNVEMQIRAVEKGLCIAETPVCCHSRIAGKSKISGRPLGMLRASWGILSMIARLHGSRRTRRESERTATARLVTHCRPDETNNL